MEDIARETLKNYPHQVKRISVGVNNNMIEITFWGTTVKEHTTWPGWIPGPTTTPPFPMGNLLKDGLLLKKAWVVAREHNDRLNDSSSDSS